MSLILRQLSSATSLERQSAFSPADRVVRALSLVSLRLSLGTPQTNANHGKPRDWLTSTWCQDTAVAGSVSELNPRPLSVPDAAPRQSVVLVVVNFAGGRAIGRVHVDVFDVFRPLCRNGMHGANFESQIATDLVVVLRMRRSIIDELQDKIFEVEPPYVFIDLHRQEEVPGINWMVPH